MTTAPLPPKIQHMQPQTQQPEYDKNHTINNTSGDQSQRSNNTATAIMNMTSEHIYCSGNGGIEADIHNTSMPLIQFGKGKDQGPLPPPPLPHSTKPGWPGQPSIQQHDEKLKQQIPFSFSPNTKANIRQKNDEEAIPSDSLYGGGHHQVQQVENTASQKSGINIMYYQNDMMNIFILLYNINLIVYSLSVSLSYSHFIGFASWREKQFGSRPSLNGLAAWSSHGYLAKSATEGGPKHSPHTSNDVGGINGTSGNGIDSGYVLLKRQDDGQMVTVQSQNAPTNVNATLQQSQSQPQSLPTIQQAQMQYQYPTQITQDNDRKYFRFVEFNIIFKESFNNFVKVK